MSFLKVNDKIVMSGGAPVKVPDPQTKTVELSMASGNQTISPDSGKVLSKVTVTKPSTLISANIKKDVVIGGVTGALESGSQSETWVIDETPTLPSDADMLLGEFISGDTTFKAILQVSERLYFDTTRGEGVGINVWAPTYGWGNGREFRKLIFITPPTGDLLTWLQANAVKQPSDQAIQTDKSLTVTSNGTVSVLPDEPYDAMSKVNLTVNVAGSETATVQITLNYFDPAAASVYVSSSQSISDGKKCIDYYYNPYSMSDYLNPSVYIYPTIGDYVIFYADSGYLSALPTVTGGATLIQGKAGSSLPLIYKITGDAAFSQLGGFYCIIAGTLITLFDGSKKTIEDITYDDELLVWDFYNGCFSSAKPRWVKVKQTATEYNKVAFSNGSVVGFVGQGGVNGYHRIFNADVGAFTHTGTSDTPNGTHTFAENGVSPTVVSQEIVHEQVDFYNVITDKHYNLFANGILTSCKCSNLYQINDMRYVGEQLIKNEEIVEYFDNIESVRKR